MAGLRQAREIAKESQAKAARLEEELAASKHEIVRRDEEIDEQTLALETAWGDASRLTDELTAEKERYSAAELHQQILQQALDAARNHERQLDLKVLELESRLVEQANSAELLEQLNAAQGQIQEYGGQLEAA
ncbi:unnamed protein product, partial [Phaeothamnion confervicola]